jgi:hypothetical protein
MRDFPTIVDEFARGKKIFAAKRFFVPNQWLSYPLNIPAPPATLVNPRHPASEVLQDVTADQRSCCN